MSASAVDAQPSWGSVVSLRARQLAGITAAGALLGLLVGGVGGRLAMMLLARLNPEATGVTSDDGFRIGQLSGATFNLLLLGTFLGVLGAGVYVVLRGLMIGPRWFQLLSISLGPAVVVGDQIVHTDGVDFTVLDPAALAIALFVLIPGVFCLLLAAYGERWLDDDGPFVRNESPVALLALLLWLPVFPALLVLVAGFFVLEAVRRTPFGGELLAHPGWPWLMRALLTVIFAVSVIDLAAKAAELV